GHFHCAPWVALCEALHILLPQQHRAAAAGGSTLCAESRFRQSFPCAIADVLAGRHDLRAPLIAAVIDTATKASDANLVVTLADPTGKIQAVVHQQALFEHAGDLVTGAALALRRAAIWVSGPGTQRALNIHPDNIMAVFPVSTPMPS
ncbi:hypothetical protein JKP88DRAFT_156304, partial [Tribonema minus]